MPLNCPHRLYLSGSDNTTVFLDENEPRIAFTKDTIRIGCTIVDADAARFILSQHTKWLLQEDEYILQHAAIHGK